LEAFSRPRRGGIIALNIRDNDQLIEAKVSSGSCNVVFVTQSGMGINFHENDVRPMGRTATGVKAIQLKKGDKAIAMVVARKDFQLLTISEKGYGKRTPLSEFRLQKRGGRGIIAMRTTEKTGQLISALGLEKEEEIMIISEKGIVIRQNTRDISVIGRNTQGVRLIRLDPDDRVSDVAKIVTSIEEDN